MNRSPHTRRQFLAGAVAAGVLAACGSESSSPDDGAADASGADPDAGEGTDPVDSAGPSDPADSADLAAGTYTIVQRFPQGVQVPGELRLPISLSTGSAQLVDDGPDVLGARVLTLDGQPLGEPMTAVRRALAPAAYYTFRPTIDTPGFYTLVVDGGPEEGASFDVADPAAVPVPGPGDPLPPFATPTTADPAGVDPICTREPACPFHDVTLAEALAEARPVLYYVGTPAFCQTGTCAPALESLIAVADDAPDRYRIVHAEVYTDLTATTTTGAVEELGLFYEPVLFVADASGTIVERLDALFDETELREVLDRVL